MPKRRLETIWQSAFDTHDLSDSEDSLGRENVSESTAKLVDATNWDDLDSSESCDGLESTDGSENGNSTENQNIKQSLNQVSLFERSEITVVTVGSSHPVNFYVHKSVLCARSEYFQKALGGKFKEAQGNTITLPTLHAQGFKLFLNWIYANSIEPFPSGSEPDTRAMRQLYVLAVFLCLDQLADHVLEVIRSRTVLQLLGQPFLDEIPAGKGLWKFAVECHAWVQYGYKRGSKTRRTSTKILASSPEVSIAVIQRLAKFRAPENNRHPFGLFEGCRYHLHNKDETCGVKAIKHVQMTADTGRKRKVKRTRFVL